MCQRSAAFSVHFPSKFIGKGHSLELQFVFLIPSCSFASITLWPCSICYCFRPKAKPTSHMEAEGHLRIQQELLMCNGNPWSWRPSCRSILPCHPLWHLKIRPLLQILSCILSSAASDGVFLGCSAHAVSASEVGFSRRVWDMCDALIPWVHKCFLAGVQHPVQLMRDSSELQRVLFWQCCASHDPRGMSGCPFPSPLACVLCLAPLPKPVQMRVIWMLLPCQVVTMLAALSVAYQHSAGLESELLDRGHGDTSSLNKHRRTQAFS